MKRLIICADGTWNDEDRVSAATNVSKLHKALQTYHVEGVNQLVYYHGGVGTKWGSACAAARSAPASIAISATVTNSWSITTYVVTSCISSGSVAARTAVASRTVIQPGRRAALPPRAQRALGYPLPFFLQLRPLLALLGINWWFHGTTLSRTVQYAYHAPSGPQAALDAPAGHTLSV